MIRQATIKDAQALGQLTSQLGYSVSVTEMITRLERIISQKDAALFVHEEESQLTGWVHIYGKTLLQMKYCEIGGLIVDEAHRNKGIAHRLMRRCQEWALEHDYTEIRLRSGSEREQAHQFYENLGYTLVKSQQLFNLKV